MKKTILNLLFADTIFILFLSLRSVTSGIFSLSFYALSYVVPTLMLLYCQKSAPAEVFPIKIAPDKNSLRLSLVFSAPVIAGVFLLSMLMSILASFLGAKPQPLGQEGNIFYIIVIHALAPAIFEEMLFRYLPLRMMAAESQKLAVVYSSLLFALSHCNLFQLPHAIFAGFAFALITVASGSIFPSLIIHFLNNVLSLIWQRSEKETLFLVIFLGLIISAFSFSMLMIFLKRKKYLQMFASIFCDKSKVKFTFSFAIYAAATLLIGVISMFF